MDKPQLPKMLKKLYLYLLLLCFLAGFRSYAQTFPISVTTQITQPSPIYLTKYADAATINSPIKIQLTLNDLTISNRQVKLKIYFQGNGISFNTNDFVVGAKPLYLEGGFPLQLTNVDLAPYFEYQNLLGVNQNQYAQPLPEGIYNIYVEVYDFATGKKLSKKTGSTTIIFQNEPPFLNLPLNNASIMQQNIQNIVFSWTPRSINVSNVEYEFSLVEIWDNYTPVQNAFAYSPPLYTTTTKMTTLQYGINEPQLIPGKKYAWRIKAKAILGAEEIGVFKNNGYTEIFAFTYEMFCTAPLAITTSGVSQDQAKITWSGNIDNFDYQVNYREKNAGSEWYKAVTPRENITLSNLKPNTTYEYTVGSSCDVGKYVHSTINEFTTIAKDEIAFAGCGIKPDPNDLANKTPLPNLYPNDVVTAGDFPIVVSKATGSNGSFTGEGYVTLPFLEKFKKLIDAADALGGDKTNIGKFSRIRITFNNIGVNTDFKLISGEIVASYDPAWTGVGDLDGVVNDAFGDAGNVVNHQYDLSIKSVVKNPDGTITVTSTTGVTSVIDKTVNDIIITDKDGKQFTVPANATAGNIEQTGQLAPGGIPTPKNTNGMGSGGDVAEISSADVKVTFSQGDGKYSFDTAPLADNGSLGKTYQAIPQKNGGTYKVNYKAISDSPNSTDVVVATVDFKNGKTKKDLVFKTQNGTAIDSTKIVWKDNVATLTLKKTLDFAKETIIATVKPVTPKDPKETTGKYDIAGTIDLWHLTNKKVNVTLVSVNNATIPNDAQKQLNAIYEPAGITFEVNTINVSLDNSWGDSIETSDSDLLNTYTPEQQQITANLKTQLGSNYEKDTYYVIYTDAPSNKSNLLGFMPLKRQYGFIFNKNNTVRTLAHELGHGVFGLQHPFTQYNTSTTTDQLMDYGTGVVLSHNDWQVLHAPGLQLYPFIQGDSDGEHVEVSNMENLYTNFKNTDGSLTFLTPAGKPFTIKEKISSVGFSYFDDNWSTDRTSFEDTVLPIGTLKRFTLTNGKTYSIAHPVKDDNKIDIVGYAELDKNGQAIQNTLYIDKTSSVLKTRNIIVGIPAIEKGQLIFKVQKINNYKNSDIPKDNYGSGPQESVYFLNTYIKELKQGINISSSISPLDINELYFISEFSSDLYGMNALHAIRIAYFLRNNPDLINCLGYAQNQIGKDVTLRFNQEMRDGLRSSLSKNQGTTRVSIPVFYADISNNVKKDIFTSTKYLASLDAILHTYYNELKNKGNVSIDLSLSDLSEVIDGLGRECLLSNIPIEKRVEFLKQYKTWKISGSKEDMLLELLINIRPSDIPQLLTSLADNNYELLRGLYNDMNDKEDYYTLLSVISTYVAEQKKNTPEAISLQGDWKAGAEKYVYVCKDAIHILTCNVEITEFNKANGKVIIKFQDFSNTFNDKPVFKTVEVDPFDLIRVKFENDFDIKGTNGKEIKEGQDAIVPAIYLYWIMKQQQDKTTSVQVRIALDILAIIPAVFSANPELVVLVDAAVATTDIAFQLSSDAIKSSDNQALNNLVDGWDDIYKVYSLGRLVSSAPAILKGGKDLGKVVFNRENLNKTITRAKAIPSELNNISKAFYKFYKAIKNSESITIVATKKQILENTIYGAYVEITLAEKCTALDEFKLLFQNNKIIVGVNSKMANGTSYAQGVSVASVTETNGALILSELRTLPSTYTGSTKVVETIKNVNIAGKGVQTIEIITTDIGQFYARQLLAASQDSNFIASIEKNYPTTFSKIKNDITLKNKFETDFKNANTSVLTEIEDIAHFDDDYNSFVTLWKSTSSTELLNYVKDLDKFKAWWYPNKAKVNNEFFINLKAYEESLNAGYLQTLHLEKISSNVRGQYWNYYKQSQWDKLEALAKEYKINFDAKSNALWPPANGGYGPLVKRVPNENEVFDRYGGSFGDLPDGTPNLGGAYTSPMFNGKPYDFDGRALNMEKEKYDFYYKIIIKDPSKFEIETNRAIPWFGKVGKAEQSRFIIKDKDPVSGYAKTWSQLAQEGSVEIQVIESPSGKYSTWVGKGRTISKTITSGGNTLSELKSLGFTDDIANKIIAKNKSLNLSEAEVKTLMQDLKNNSTLMKTVNQNPENGIEAWKIFTDNKKALCD